MPTSQALLVLVFRCARAGRRPNLTAFCRRHAIGVAQLQAAFDQLEHAGLVSFCPQGEQLTLQGLAIAAALSRRTSAGLRPLVSSRRLAA